MISRFAPAPTGFLHLGHVVNAIYVWGVTRAMAADATVEGRVLVRIEDHDRQRSRASYERAILEDLDWLGFVGDGAPVRQSERHEMYSSALDRLRAQGLVYACDCSRAAYASELRYPGTCRDRELADAPGYGVRVRIDPGIERFDDLRHGLQEQEPAAQCGDLLVRDRHGNWAYQFAVVVDDAEQGVTLVVRGDDLLESTGRQIRLARLLGRQTPPRFFHHGLLMKSPTQKMSKSDGDTGVRELRDRGWTPEMVIGEAAARAGLIPAPRPIRAADVSSII